MRQWAIFEAVAGEMVGSPVDYAEWLYSLAWLSSSRYIYNKREREREVFYKFF